jgi:hypothetical protein
MKGTLEEFRGYSRIFHNSAILILLPTVVKKVRWWYMIHSCMCSWAHWNNMGSGIIMTTNSHKCPSHLWINRWWHWVGWPKLNAKQTIYIQGICKPDWYYGRMSWSITSEFWVAVICLANTSRRCAPLHVTQKQIQDYLNTFCFRIFHQCHEWTYPWIWTRQG